MDNINQNTTDKAKELQDKKEKLKEMLRDANAMVSNLSLFSLAPVIIKEFKGLDDEFYYEARKDFKDMSKQIVSAGEMMSSMVEKV